MRMMHILVCYTCTCTSIHAELHGTLSAVMATVASLVIKPGKLKKLIVSQPNNLRVWLARLVKTYGFDYITFSEGQNL